MFTGIVQGMGRIAALERPHEGFIRIRTEFPAGLAEGLQIGASVAHNGCCLTVTETDGGFADFDIMAETLAKTNLGSLNVGDAVNLERAARFGDEIGGHVMSGHIAATVAVLAREEDAFNCTLWLELPPEFVPYVLPKGFVGLDGCSLTVGSVERNRFSVHLIPETLNRTLFGTRRAGDRVNLELDAQTQAVVDTVERILAARNPQTAA